MPKSEHWRPAVRIAKATELLAKHYNTTGGFKADLAPDYDGIQGWVWLPSLYSVIEQGMKLLVLSYGSNHCWHHRLSTVYLQLQQAHKKHLGEAYKAYVDLHDYIPIPTVEEFLKQIDTAPINKKGNKTDGYTAWRYFLLEGFPLNHSDIPKNSPGSMIEIATALRYILEDELIRERLPASSSNITDRLWEALANKMSSIVQKHFFKSKIQAKVQRDGSLTAETQNIYNQLHDELYVNVDYVIKYLDGSLDIGHRRTRVGGDLDELCEFMRARDRENYLQYAKRVKDGGRAFPNISVEPSEDRKFVYRYSSAIPEDTT